MDLSQSRERRTERAGTNQESDAPPSLAHPPGLPSRLLGHAVLLVFRMGRRMGVGPVAAMSDRDLRGASHLMRDALLGALWDRRQAAPDWEAVSQAWERRAAAPAVEPRLYDVFAPGDRVELLPDNAAAFAVRERLLAAAAKRIDLATYYIQDDATGRALIELLRAAVLRGVRVRVLTDEAAMIYKQVAGHGGLDVVAALRRAGVEVRMWRDPARPYDTQHRKFLIVDDESVVLGGRNYAEHYAGSEWRDTELLLTGPCARQAAALFEHSFQNEDKQESPEGALFHATAPARILEHATFVYLLQCAARATRTIDIENAYYFNHPAVLRALTAARQRGVRVRVFTNSLDSVDLDYSGWRLYSGFRPLLEAGLELYLRRGKLRTLHSKYFVVDGEWVSLGSTNFDYLSPRHCTECDLHVRSAELGARLGAWFEEGLRDADPLTDLAAIDAVLARLGISRVLDRLIRDQQ